MEPQNTFGNPGDSALNIPQWQKDLIDTRLAEFNANPNNTLDWDDVRNELDKEDS